jgi:hypothetical protein
MKVTPMTELNIDWTDPPAMPSWETVLESHERTGGASAWGNSKWGDFVRCPQKFYLAHIKRLKPVALSEALELGGALHEVIAWYYTKSLEEAWALVARIEAATPVIGSEVRRLFTQWLRFYGPGQPRDMRSKTIAIELELGQTTPFNYTTRIDQVIVDEHGDVWIVEHKTSSGRYADLIEGYKMDPQFLGQKYLWDKSPMARKYGRAKGLLVDLIVKTKSVDCYFEVVAVENSLTKIWERDMLHIALEHSICSSTGSWPRKRHSCWKYKLCEYFQYCLSNGKNRNGYAVVKK